MVISTDNDSNKTLDQILKRYTRIALDTNSFIYLMEKHPVYLDSVRSIFKQIESGNIFGITSMLLITEVLTKPIKDNNKTLERQYKTFLGAFPNLHIRDVDYAVALKAAKLRAKYKLHTPDSLFSHCHRGICPGVCYK